MYRWFWVLFVVASMAIWPFANAGKAQDGGGGGSSSRALSERIDALERKIDRLEAKINRLESPSASGSAASRQPALTAGGRGPCPGEWRKIGGGWVCTDPNAK